VLGVADAAPVAGQRLCVLAARALERHRDRPVPLLARLLGQVAQQGRADAVVVQFDRVGGPGAARADQMRGAQHRSLSGEDVALDPRGAR